MLLFIRCRWAEGGCVSKQALERVIATARKELDDIEDQERALELAGMAGQCFKYRNCYSCPQSEADYWWLYQIVTEVVGPSAKVLQFSIDKDGKVSIESDRYFSRSGWQPITRAEFNRAWKATMRQIAKVAP